MFSVMTIGRKLLSISSFSCRCSSSRWFALGIVWRDDDNIHEKLSIAKRDFPYPFFMEVVMIGAWCIWNERNALIFNGKAPNLLAWKAAFKKKVSDHLCRIKSTLHESISFFVGSMLCNFLAWLAGLLVFFFSSFSSPSFSSFWLTSS